MSTAFWIWFSAVIHWRLGSEPILLSDARVIKIDGRQHRRGEPHTILSPSPRQGHNQVCDMVRSTTLRSQIVDSSKGFSERVLYFSAPKDVSQFSIVPIRSDLQN